MLFRVLGPLSIETDEGATLPVNAHRQRSVVAMLLIAGGRSVTADRLIDGIWGDDLPANPANTLQNSIAQLRKTFEPDRPRSEPPTVLVSTPTGYQLAVDDHDTDAARFETGLQQARGYLNAGHARAALDSITDALSLWRGQAYVDFQDDEFAVGERERLEELRLEALELAIDARGVVDGPESVIGDLDALLADHPHREGSWGRLMTALYQAGRQAEALRTYQQATKLLGDELGIAPSPELQDLEDRILMQDPSLAPDRSPTPPHNIPAPAGTLVGRDAELADMLQAVSANRVVTLLGPGGSGKTRLALQAAWDIVSDLHAYDHGVWLVRLDDLTDPSLVDPAIGAAIGMPESAKSTVRETLVGHLRSRRMLLVLDNCEHVLDAVSELVNELLAAAPGLSVLATSQARLALLDEQRFQVAPLAVPDDLSGPFAELSEAPSVELFIERAKHFDPDQAFGDEDLLAIANIVSSLDGMPLAIELAAARTTALTPPEIARLMADRFDLLSSGRPTAPDRQRSLRSAVEWSFNLLSDDDKDLFVRLSVCVGGFDLGAAAAMADASEASTANGLHRLIGSSLLTKLRNPTGATRYRMLESLRQFGRERLDADPDLRDETNRRHATRYAGIVTGVETGLMGPDQGAAYQSFVDDEDNYRAAMTFALESGDHFDLGVRIAASMGRFWDLAGSLSEANRWLSTFVEAAGDRTSPPGYPLLVGWHGFFISELGDREAAAEVSLSALPLAQRLGDRAAESALLSAASMYARLAGEMEEALSLAESAHQIAAAEDESWYEALALNAATHSHIEAGDPESARPIAEAALATFADVGDQRAVGWALTALAQVELMEEKTRDALETALRAIEVSTSAFDDRNAAWAYELAASAAAAAGDDDRAHELEAESKALVAKRGMPLYPWERT